MKQKIRVFLGGYVNYLNAQNINCRALSEHLDKEKFVVSTMLFPIQNANDFQPLKEVRYFKFHSPLRLWRYLIYLRGIASADIAYLPKGEIDGYCRRIAKIFRTKVFTTVEGILDDILKSRVGEKNFDGYIEHFRKYEPNLYSITKYIKQTEAQDKGYNFADKILYLGVDSSIFIPSAEKRKQDIHGLKNVIFIGNDLIRKNVTEFLDVARVLPNVCFHIVGGNMMKGTTIENYIEQNGLGNVKYHGRLDHSRMSALLAEMDLMYFPSRSEGFPKVHLETACAGVPTLCYNDYGAEEWITSWENGIVVTTKEEALNALKRLIEEPETLHIMSENAIKLGESFDWKKLTPVWEKEIERLYNSK